MDALKKLTNLGYDILGLNHIIYGSGPDQTVCLGGTCDGGCENGCQSCRPGCQSGGVKPS